jgi:5-methylcytosine-specific restriction endonuclease McrA
MNKTKLSKSLITFDVGSIELKKKTKELAKSFQPNKISLTNICQIALKEYIQKLKEKKRKEKENECSKKYYYNNKERIKARQKEQREMNSPKLRFNFNRKIRSGIAKSLKGNKNGKHWEDLVGYTLEELINHLKKTMPEGYTWQDYLEHKLHIDHIVPISAFNFNKPKHIDFKNCWSLDNLRLLPMKENLSKGNRIMNPILLWLLIKEFCNYSNST